MSDDLKVKKNKLKIYTKKVDQLIQTTRIYLI